MCKFFSAILMKNEDLIYNEFTSSHEDLIDEYNLQDKNENFIRLEFSPDNILDLDKIEKYILHIDKNYTPDWFTNEIKENVTNRLINILNKIIIKENKKILIGKTVILSDGVIIDKIKNCIIIAMYGSSQVNNMYGSSQIDNMYGSSQVNNIYDSSQVNNMCDLSQVNSMYDLSHVINMYNSSQINHMYNSSQVNNMHNSSQVKKMYGSSRMKDMNIKHMLI